MHENARGSAECRLKISRQENPFPAPVQDTLAAYRWLLAHGYEHRKIVLGGDSTGGGLVVAAIVVMRYVGEPLPAAGVCISPWVDMEATGQSFITNATSDPSVAKDRILRFAGLYLADKSSQTPLAAPIHADLLSLPPLLVQVGSIETLLDDANAPMRLACQWNWRSGRTCRMCGITLYPSSRRRSRPLRTSASSSASMWHDVLSPRRGLQTL